MGAIGFRRIVYIGYKYDGRSAQYKLLDVNPQIGTTFRLFVDSGGMDVARTVALPASRSRRDGWLRVERWVVENFDLISSPAYIRGRSFTARGWIRRMGAFRRPPGSPQTTCDRSWPCAGDPYDGDWAAWGWGRQYLAILLPPWTFTP
jgi:hypothetical protein